METSYFLPVILQAAGVAVIIAEIIIPSGGLLSLIATCLIGYSLYLVFSISPDIGTIFILADLIIIPLAVLSGIKLLAKSPVTLSTELSQDSGVCSQSSEMDAYVGMSGKTLTDLRPSGMALIDGKKLDVVTRGEYLEKSSEITVLSVTGNQIIVSIKKRDS